MLRSYGHNVILDTLVSEIGCVKILGTSLPIGRSHKDIAETIRKYEPSTQFDQFATFDFLLSLLAQGKPAAVLLNTDVKYDSQLRCNIPLLHWMIASGFDGEHRLVRLYDTSSNEELEFPYEAFKNMWSWMAWGQQRPCASSLYEAFKFNILGGVDHILGRNTLFWIDKEGYQHFHVQRDLEGLSLNPNRYLDSFENRSIGGRGVENCGLERAYADAVGWCQQIAGKNDGIDLYLDLNLLQQTHRSWSWRDGGYLSRRRACEYSAHVKSVID